VDEDDLWITRARSGRHRRRHHRAGFAESSVPRCDRWQADPHHRHVSAEERKRRGSPAVLWCPRPTAPLPLATCPHHHDDDAIVPIFAVSGVGVPSHAMIGMPSGGLQLDIQAPGMSVNFTLIMIYFAKANTNVVVVLRRMVCILCSL
jgi:hypothetical protein